MSFLSLLTVVAVVVVTAFWPIAIFAVKIPTLIKAAVIIGFNFIVFILIILIYFIHI
jgi:hypothetical protein